MATIVNDGGAGNGIQGSTKSHDSNGVVGLNTDPKPRTSAKPSGNGVFGSTMVPDGAGVMGLHDTGGVGVAGFGHPAGIGVVGISAPAGKKGGDGVFGVTNSEHRNGLVGRNDSTEPRAALNAGGNGVLGFTQVPDGATGFFETDIDIPNINCAKCTLQIIQFMAEHGLNRDGDYSYHHCADVQITADPAKPIDTRWPAAR